MTSTENVAQAGEELLSNMYDRILVLTINRPSSYNSWTSNLRDEIARCLDAADANTDVDGVVITGVGDRAFCAGQDLNDLQAFADGTKIENFLNRLTVCYDAVRGFSKPLVAAVNGVAAGSGFQVTQFCDYVIAHPGVRMGQTEVNSGLPSVFGTWLMWERVGRRAIELSLQGRLMVADEAKQMGFVHEIAEQPKVLEVAIQAAKRLAQQPRHAYRISKQANRAMDEERYKNAMHMALGAYRDAFDTGAPQAEIARFFEKRAKKHQATA